MLKTIKKVTQMFNKMLIAICLMSQSIFLNSHANVDLDRHLIKILNDYFSPEAQRQIFIIINNNIEDIDPKLIDTKIVFLLKDLLENDYDQKCIIEPLVLVHKNKCEEILNQGNQMYKKNATPEQICNTFFNGLVTPEACKTFNDDSAEYKTSSLIKSLFKALVLQKKIKSLI